MEKQKQKMSDFWPWAHLHIRTRGRPSFVRRKDEQKGEISVTRRCNKKLSKIVQRLSQSSQSSFNIQGDNGQIYPKSWVMFGLLLQ